MAKKSTPATPPTVPTTGALRQPGGVERLLLVESARRLVTEVEAISVESPEETFDGLLAMSANIASVTRMLRNQGRRSDRKARKSTAS